MADFKRFKVIKMKNVTVGGEYEYKISPWFINIMIGLRCKPTEKAEQDFRDIHEFRQHMAHQVFGKKNISFSVQKVMPFGWSYQGFAYAYDHDPRQVEFGRESQFQFEVYVLPPEDYEKNRDLQGLEKEFKLLTEKEVTKIEKIFKEIFATE